MSYDEKLTIIMADNGVIVEDNIELNNKRLLFINMNELIQYIRDTFEYCFPKESR